MDSMDSIWIFSFHNSQIYKSILFRNSCVSNNDISIQAADTMEKFYKCYEIFLFLGDLSV